MKVILLCAFCAVSSVLSSQDEFRFSSSDGNVIVTCEIQSSKIVTRIISIEIKEPLSEEIINVPTTNRDDIYLHITSRDTALFVKDGDSYYYLYHLVSDLSETDRFQALSCTYSKVIYPQHARSRAVGGTVIVDAYLDELGCVVSIDPKTEIGYGLEKATIRAVKKCSCNFPQVKFQGEFVKSVFTIPLKFKLD